ncbi:hypothetical protein ACUY1T_02760 [Billgrantia sp. Q4P2]|uniref:hypothetical protein n=1 Tax=Billgrantia sp. Q4P2 TaxID=3463857 RepID=UPI0040573AEE
MSRRLSFAFLVVLSAMLVAGCSYQPARIKSEPLIVIDDGRSGGHHGRFCPPGQAKKGRC